MSEVDHKALIASLSPVERRSLLEQTDFHGLRHLALHVGAIALVATGIVIGLDAFPLMALLVLMLIQGVLICFLFTLLHETAHRTPFKTDVLNLWVGRICGFLIFLAPEWFRYFHFAHHRYTHDPDKDPELATPKPKTPWQYLKLLSGLPDWFDRVKLLIRNAVWVSEENYVPHRGRAKVRVEARVFMGLYLLIFVLSFAFSSMIVVYVWLLPLLLGGPFLRAYLLAEHARCPNVASMLKNTRTTKTTRLVRALAWNMPYHIEHHAYPAVPFHQLPAFHKHTRQHIKHIENGYVNFNKSYFKDSLLGDLKTDQST